MNGAELPLRDAATLLLARCRAAGLTLATAESCTGGLIAAILTDIAGSSDVFERGCVTYSNAAKTEMLGVPATLIAEHGAVSEAVARAMARGLMARTPADLGVSVTGIAGPGGGSLAKPVGTVHLAAIRRGAACIHRRLDAGDIGRSAVREAAVAAAFELVEALLSRERAAAQAVP